MNWNPSEILFKIGFLEIRYYSLLFVIAFIVAFQIMKRIFNLEKKPLEKLDSLVMYYGILGTLIGARLGHVIFYDWAYFSNHILEIFLPFKFSPKFRFTGFAGLASHGAAIGLLLSTYLFCQKNKSFSWLWILDRASIPIAFASILIRIGNFMNSEIKGIITTASNPFKVRFMRGGDLNLYQAMSETGASNIDDAINMIVHDSKYLDLLESVPYRHPVQLYESFFYILIFITLWLIYHKTSYKNKTGMLFGVFLSTLFTVRFIAEFFKESQGGVEKILGLLSTGQWLSIPLLLLGIYLVARPQKQA